MQQRNLQLRVPPAALALGTALVMWLASRGAPLLDLAVPMSSMVSFGFLGAGAVVCIAGVVSFRRVGTTVNPMKPGKASALVVGGVYRYSRNPMYLGFLLVLIGWAVLAPNLLELLLLPGFFIYLNHFQIGPEEEALRSRFGLEYESYQAKVGRWV